MKSEPEAGSVLARARQSLYVSSMARQYRHKTTSIFLLNYHFVWIPRRRRRVLKADVATRLRILLRKKLVELDCETLALEVQPDHVHLFLSATPDLSPRQIMHRLKGYSARALRAEFPALMRMPSMWTRSYFVSTAGNVSSQTIRRYIEKQAKQD